LPRKGGSCKAQSTTALLARCAFAPQQMLPLQGNRHHEDLKDALNKRPAAQALADLGAVRRCKSSPLHQSGCGSRLAQRPNLPMPAPPGLVQSILKYSLKP